MNKNYNTLRKFVRYVDGKKEKDIKKCQNYLKDSTRLKLKNNKQKGSNIRVKLESKGIGNPWMPYHEQEKMCPCHLLRILNEMNKKCFPYLTKILNKEGIFLDKNTFDKIKKRAEKDCQEVTPKDNEGLINVTKFNENTYSKFHDEIGETIRLILEDNIDDNEESIITEREIREELSDLIKNADFFNKDEFQKRFGVVYEALENLENLEEILKHYKLENLNEITHQRAPWGAYFKKTSKYKEHIKIYLDPIYSFSKKTGLDPYLMYRKVLIHELAHAYHHKGIDADGKIWDSFWDKPKRHSKYGRSNILEGLAQWYTFNYMFELDISENKSKSIYKSKSYGKAPVFDNVYTMITASFLQSAEYNYFKNWLMYSDENMRNAIISARIDNKIIFEKDFDENLLKKHNKGL